MKAERRQMHITKLGPPQTWDLEEGEKGTGGLATVSAAYEDDWYSLHALISCVRLSCFRGKSTESLLFGLNGSANKCPQSSERPSLVQLTFLT